MNVLEQLRSDMDDAGCEADVQDENVVDACLAVLDEFSAGHEVVEVDEFPVEGRATVRRWFAHPPDTVYGKSATPHERRTIIVPRKQEPTLLAAAEGAHRWLQCFCHSQGEPGLTAEEARDGLAQAIKRARDGE